MLKMKLAITVGLIIVGIGGLFYEATVGQLAWILLAIFWGLNLVLDFLSALVAFIWRMHRMSEELPKEAEAFMQRVTRDIEETLESNREACRTFLDGKTMDDYRKAHPESFDGKKFKSCHSCGCDKIWIRNLGRSPYGFLMQHLCRQCGIRLWNSKL